VNVSSEFLSMITTIDTPLTLLALSSSVQLTTIVSLGVIVVVYSKWDLTTA